MSFRSVTIGCFALGWVLCLAITSVLGQDPQIRRPNPSMRAFAWLQQGKYLAALATLDAATEGDAMNWQELATVRSFVGDEPGALKAMDAARVLSGSRSSIPAETIDEYSPAAAIEAIVRNSKGRQIVILNEAHHIPRHRAFSLLLAQRLQKEGFNYVAAEAFAPEINSVSQHHYPTRNTGYYSLEPLFGDLIRQVLRLGYRPIAYKTTTAARSGDHVGQIGTARPSLMLPPHRRPRRARH